MITAVIAIGRSGQMGLNNKLPWHDPADLRRFQQVTAGGILIAGHHTYESMAHLRDKYGDLSCNRTMVMALRNTPVVYQIVSLKKRYPERPWFVIGGAKTLVRWAPYIGRWDISRVDYDGPADTWFNPSLLNTGEHHVNP